MMTFIKDKKQFKNIDVLQGAIRGLIGIIREINPQFDSLDAFKESIAGFQIETSFPETITRISDIAYEFQTEGIIDNTHDFIEDVYRSILNNKEIIHPLSSTAIIECVRTFEYEYGALSRDDWDSEVLPWILAIAAKKDDYIEESIFLALSQRGLVENTDPSYFYEKLYKTSEPYYDSLYRKYFFVDNTEEFESPLWESEIY